MGPRNQSGVRDSSSGRANCVWGHATGLQYGVNVTIVAVFESEVIDEIYTAVTVMLDICHATWGYTDDVLKTLLWRRRLKFCAGSDDDCQHG